LIAASLGYKERDFHVPEGISINEFLLSINLPVTLSWTITSINQVIKDKSTILQDGDSLHVFPAGGGGSTHIFRR